MSYNVNIPQITDPILQSQAQILSNFQAINATFGDNHSNLTTNNETLGMHKVMTMRPQASDPTTSATQTALYNKLVSSIPALFFMPNSAQTPIQLTYPSIKTGNNGATPPVFFPQQYSFVAGPFIVYGGFLENVTNGFTVTLTPGTNLIYVDLTMTNLPRFTGGGPFSGTAAATNISGTSFVVNYQGTIPPIVPDIYYMAIGM